MLDVLCWPLSCPEEPWWLLWSLLTLGWPGPRTIAGFRLVAPLRLVREGADGPRTAGLQTVGTGGAGAGGLDRVEAPQEPVPR